MVRRLRDISLSWRLAALYVTILVAVLATLGVVLYVRVENFLLDDTKNRLESAARAAIIHADRPNEPRRGPGGSSPDPGVRLTGLTQELTSRDTVARVLAPDGTVIATGPAYPDQPVPPDCASADLQRTVSGAPPPAQIGQNTRQLVVLMPVRLNDTTTGALQITTSLAAADDLLAELRLILIVGVLGAVALGAALGVPVTR